MSSSPQHPPTNDRADGPSAGLWAGVIGAPAAWSLQFFLGYSLAGWFCHSRAFWLMHVITALCVVAVLVGALLCWREFKTAGGGSFEDVSSGPIGRRRFMGALGLLISVLFVIVIVSQAVPGFFFDGCWI